MPSLPSKSRLPLCVLLIISFFIPASNDTSAFNFIGLAFSELKNQKEITLIDVLILITPLILIPFVAVVVFIRAAMKVRTRRTVLALPLLLFVFFLALLSFTGDRSLFQFSLFRLLFEMQVGFYLTALASLLLMFTKDKRRRRQKRTVLSPETESEMIVQKDV